MEKPKVEVELFWERYHAIQALVFCILTEDQEERNQEVQKDPEMNWDCDIKVARESHLEHAQQYRRLVGHAQAEKDFARLRPLESAVSRRDNTAMLHEARLVLDEVLDRRGSEQDEVLIPFLKLLHNRISLAYELRFRPTPPGNVRSSI